MSGDSKHDFEVFRTGMICQKHVDCINNFLQYDRELLEHTRAIWKDRDNQPKIIPGDKREEYANDLYQLGYVSSKKNALQFIQHWNESPTICCMVEGMEREGKCVNHRSQCYHQDQFDGVRRIRDLTLDELLEIKLKAGIIPNDSECLSDKHCKDKYKVSWRDPFRYKCSNYKCEKEGKVQNPDNVDISSFDSLEQLEFALDNQ